MSLRVKVEVRQSTIHGKGLFALERIPVGAIVWAYDSKVDRVQPIEEPNGYSWRTNLGYVVPGDNARFINHSNTPNLSTTPGLTPTIAARDIEPGEELTECYDYDLDWNGTP